MWGGRRGGSILCQVCVGVGRRGGVKFESGACVGGEGGQYLVMCVGGGRRRESILSHVCVCVWGGGGEEGGACVRACMRACMHAGGREGGR